MATALSQQGNSFRKDSSLEDIYISEHLRLWEFNNQKYETVIDRLIYHKIISGSFI